MSLIGTENQREEVLNFTRILEDDINTMFSQIEDNFKANAELFRFIELAMNAIDYRDKEVDLQDFLIFCRTGKYPV